LWSPASAAREILMTVVPPPSDAGIQGTECTVLNTQRFRRPLFRVPDEPQMVALWFLRAVFADQRPTLEEQLSAKCTPHRSCAGSNRLRRLFLTMLVRNNRAGVNTRHR
jgi:hypothetical protein